MVYDEFPKRVKIFFNIYLTNRCNGGNVLENKQRKVIVMSIRISEKYGVNPMIPTCFYCGKEKNEIVLLGRLPNDKEAPKHGVIDRTPCAECIEYMKKGIILISVRKGESGDNPYRTGGWVVIKEEAATRMFGDHLKESRVAFVDDETWEKLGLPKE